MRRRDVLLVPLLFAAGCGRPRPIDLEPTLEEQSPLASIVYTKDAETAPQLLRGFHQLEATWRWTMPTFAVELLSPVPAGEPARLTLKFAIPELSISRLGRITLSASAGDVALAPETYTTAGNHAYQRDLPASALRQNLVTAQFSVDKFLPAGSVDGRDLGVIVFSIGLERL